MNSTTIDKDDQISSLSDTQAKVLAFLPVIPCLLSVWGSANIIVMFFTSKRSSAYRRIMLGLSCADFIGSMLYIFMPFLVPRETSENAWAIGNDTTCTALGFSTQFSFTSIWYNGTLSVYFVLLVKFGMKDQVFQRKYEPWMHVACIGYPLATAITGAWMGLYREFNLGDGCW